MPSGMPTVGQARSYWVATPIWKLEKRMKYLVGHQIFLEKSLSWAEIFLHRLAYIVCTFPDAVSLGYKNKRRKHTHTLNEYASIY